ncbi:MAG: hypothetical protein K2M31_04720 [Muribaculaceae bacterium]|nr:hypothetical protein [Muribaculaceae bacterium]
MKKTGKSKSGASSAGIARSSDVSTFENPDFAYPVDVRKNAAPVFEEALRDNDGEKAILAAMQLSVAARQISSDSIGSIAERYDRIAATCNSPWKEMASLLKAKLLREVYTSNSWKFDQRELPADQLNSEPMLWSGQQFKSQINKALDKVFVSPDALSVIPISIISGILTDTADAEKAGFSVLDFATYQSLDIVREINRKANSIPFRQVEKDGSVASTDSSENIVDVVSGDSGREHLTVDSLLETLISADANRGAEGERALFRARLAKINYIQEANSSGNAFISGYPATLLKIYPQGSEFRAPLLIALYLGSQFNTSEIANSRKLYTLLNDALAGPATADEKNILKGIMSRLTEPSYNLTTQGRWLPATTSGIEITSRNVTGGYLLLVPVAAAQCEGQSGDKLMNENLRPTGKIQTLLQIADGGGNQNGNVNSESGIFPSERKDTLEVGPLSPGYYALVMSASHDLSGIFSGVKRSRPDIVHVCGLNVFSSDDSEIKDNKAISERLLYVTDGRNNNPVSGAKVNFTSTVYNEKGKTTSGVTDNDGKIRVPFRQCRAVITHGNDRILWDGGQGYAYAPDDNQLSGSILTDLALYHPGDSIRAVIVVSECKDNLLSVAADRKFDLVLRDANYKEIERVTLTSDDYGRAVASLQIPSEGLTGNFSLQISDSNRIFGRASVQVAEYQAPTFRVVMESPEVGRDNSSSDDEIRISGMVTTYSGSPIADAEVTISINFQPWWRPWMQARNIGNSYNVKVPTDGKGRFETILAMSSEDARDYAFGHFSAIAAASIPAGETQSSSPESFAIGEGYSLQFAGNTDINVDGKDIALPIKVSDISGHSVSRKLQYEIVKLDSRKATPDFSNPIVEGEFVSPKLSLSSSALPSGLYMLRVIMSEAVKIEDKDGNKTWRPDTLQTQLVIFRESDKTPPMPTALWVPKEAYYAQPGQKNIEVIVGASYKENAVYCQIADANGTLRREWLRPKGENMTVKVAAPKDGETVRLYLGGCHDLQTIERFVTIFPPRESRTTFFRVDTFRDRLVPGQREIWKFRLMSGWENKSVNMADNADLSDNLPDSAFVGDGAVIAVLSNSALDAITPFNWRFSPRSLLSTRTLGGIDFPWLREISSFENLGKTVNIDYSSVRFADPEFRYSGVSDLLGMRIRGTRSYTMSKQASLTGSVDVTEEVAMLYDAEASADMMSANAVKSEGYGMSEKKMNGAMLAESEVHEEEEDGEVANHDNGASVNESELRSMEMPLAFFRPMLNTDEDGYVTLEFEVPNFNTEWNLQLLGYDKQLNSTILRKSAVASKPVMVSTSMPRFLTTGDLTQISATVINNTDQPLSIDTRLDIFDIATGKVLAFESTGARLIDANSTGQASITFTVPSDYSLLGVRAVSRSDKGSDGEQGALTVLPSSTPVSDALTFYFEPGCDEKKIQLPKMTTSDKVTLNFCNNPEWLVLTALSGNIEPDSESALVQAAAMYANAVASGILSRNPSLRSGLEKMISRGDSMLISPLQQNQELKLQSLNSTPWVNNAESETERMANLSSLLDKTSMEKSIARRIDALAKTNNSDGSWSWMKGMPGSEWITRQVLSCLGSLRTSGYLPADKRLASMISNGVKYCDAVVGKDYTETVKKYRGQYPLIAEISYLYDRRSATDSKPSGVILEMKRDMLRRLPSEWRKLSVMEKATAAILLKEEGGSSNISLAKGIMESVRQFASYTPDKGMWFDTSSEGWSAPSPLWLTARCLEAFRTVEADSKSGQESISRLEQYLILSRQTRDWNLELGEAGVAAVANSILIDADKLDMETGKSSELQAFLDGTPIEISENGCLNLDPMASSGKTLTIHRHGSGPAWGGVLTQYVAPIEDVKAHETAQLKIKKSLLPIEVESGKRNAGSDAGTFRKGDRVLVTLTLETDRDMDYVLLTDRLGSWMQPKEQLTEYQPLDGLWLLRETRRADVNFYITRLPKGRYVLSYEVTAARDGRYSTGIASAQSQYYPLITSHTAGRLITIE